MCGVRDGCGGERASLSHCRVVGRLSCQKGFGGGAEGEAEERAAAALCAPPLRHFIIEIRFRHRRLECRRNGM